VVHTRSELGFDIVFISTSAFPPFQTPIDPLNVFLLKSPRPLFLSMDTKRGVSALGRKVRLMRRPQDTSNTFRNPRLPRSPAAPLELALDLPSPKSDEIAHLETQKKILMTKLSQLSQDYANEEQKRKRLEDEVQRARSRASGVFQQTSECEALRDRLRIVQSKLDGAQSKYSENLDSLAGFRAQLDHLRNERLSRRTAAPAPEPAIDPPRTIGHITDAERAELSAARRTQGSITSSKTAVDVGGEEIVAEADYYQNMIQKILDAVHMNSLPELFAEADRLEKENREMYAYLVENEEPRRRLIEEIASLEQQYRDLAGARDEGEREQKQKLEKLNSDIVQMQEQLQVMQAQKERDVAEVSIVYAAIDELFNALHCSWEGAPDGATTVTSGNAVFALEAIEFAVADMAGAGQAEE
jgi:flagellar biosynthesis/type III secretory pathway chaperone